MATQTNSQVKSNKLRLVRSPLTSSNRISPTFVKNQTENQCNSIYSASTYWQFMQPHVTQFQCTQSINWRHKRYRSQCETPDDNLIKHLSPPVHSASLLGLVTIRPDLVMTVVSVSLCLRTGNSETAWSTVHTFFLSAMMWESAVGTSNGYSRWTGRNSIPCWVFTRATRHTPSRPGISSMIFAIGQCSIRWSSAPTNTTSPTFGFRWRFSLARWTNWDKYSLRNRTDNSRNRDCLFQYSSSRAAR